MQHNWRDVKTLYQIYPRSFQDSNGDGVGDLRGITSRLDYLAHTLGVDAVWISPFFTSPMTDFGYDVANYRDVDPDFGTLHDFRTLLDEAHARNIKVMIDLVPCHSSDQHEWFVASRSSRNHPKRDYYVWRDPADDGGPPNNWRSLAAGRSWTFDETTGQYYLHSFLPTQPDLNWDNPAVREEMKNIVRFWYNMGVDGLRVDAIWGISKDPALADDPINPGHYRDPEQYGSYIHTKCKYGPNFVAHLHELASVNDEYEDRRIVYEFYPDEQLGDIYAQYGDVLHAHPTASAFFMEYRQDDWHAERTGKAIETYLRQAEQTTPFFCIGNHDQPRVVSRLGEERARALSFLNLTTPGISVLYYGDEIGMENGLLSQEDIRDTFSPSSSTFDSRDRERTPMQWDNTPSAGFSSTQPWLPVHSNRSRINVAMQIHNPNSSLGLHRQLIHLRKTLPALAYGTCETIYVDSGYVLALKREYEGQTIYVLVNFADQKQRIALPGPCKILLSSVSISTGYQPQTIGRYEALLCVAE